MARKLKTYLTSMGFFDLAIAAPSMKAALAAWDAKANLFHQGFARETDDPAIIAATMAKPGVILRRVVGTNDAFGEHADLPKSLPARMAKQGGGGEWPAKPRPSPGKSKRTGSAPDKVDRQRARESAARFELEQQRRERMRRREAIAREREEAARKRALEKAEAAVDAARAAHDGRRRAIEAAREALDRKSEAEDARWSKQKRDLERAVRRARM